MALGIIETLSSRLAGVTRARGALRYLGWFAQIDLLSPSVESETSESRSPGGSNIVEIPSVAREDSSGTCLSGTTLVGGSIISSEPTKSSSTDLSTPLAGRGVAIPGSRRKERIWLGTVVEMAQWSSEAYEERAEFVIGELKRAVDGHKKLKHKADELRYDLRMVGATLELATPTIIVSCTKENEETLRSLFSKVAPLRLNCAVDDDPSSNMQLGKHAPFKLVLFPRNSGTTISRKAAHYFLWGVSATHNRLQRMDIYALSHHDRSSCGSLAHFEGRTATLGVTLRIGGIDKILTVGHLFDSSRQGSCPTTSAIEVTTVRIQPPVNLPESSADLDWSLVEPPADRTSHNTITLTPGSEAITLKGIASQPRYHGVPVYLVSGVNGVREGVLLSGKSYVSSGQGRDLCPLWSLLLSSGVVEEGECGSAVVDKETFQVYGHLVGSDDEVGLAYLVPLVDTIEQIKTAFGTDETFLAESRESGGVSLFGAHTWRKPTDNPPVTDAYAQQMTSINRPASINRLLALSKPTGITLRLLLTIALVAIGLFFVLPRLLIVFSRKTGSNISFAAGSPPPLSQSEISNTESGRERVFRRDVAKALLERIDKDAGLPSSIHAVDRCPKDWPYPFNYGGYKRLVSAPPVSPASFFDPEGPVPPDPLLISGQKKPAITRTSEQNDNEMTPNWYVEHVYLVTSLLLPSLALLMNLEGGPIAVRNTKRKFLMLAHAIGDPIDSIWSITNRLSTAEKIYHLTQDSLVTKQGDQSRTAQARAVAAVLFAIHEISGERQDDHDLGYLRNIMERSIPSPGQLSMDHWHETALFLGQARTNYRGPCALAIFTCALNLAFVTTDILHQSSTYSHVLTSGPFIACLAFSFLGTMAYLDATLGAFTSPNVIRELIDLRIYKATGSYKYKDNLIGELGPYGEHKTPIHKVEAAMLPWSTSWDSSRSRKSRSPLTLRREITKTWQIIMASLPVFVSLGSATLVIGLFGEDWGVARLLLQETVHIWITIAVAGPVFNLWRDWSHGRLIQRLGRTGRMLAMGVVWIAISSLAAFLYFFTHRTWGFSHDTVAFDTRKNHDQDKRRIAMVVGGVLCFQFLFTTTVLVRYRKGVSVLRYQGPAQTPKGCSRTGWRLGLGDIMRCIWKFLK